MAFGQITFKNPYTGSIKEAPIGFSWTTFFFSPFPAFMRGHVSYGFIILTLAIITGGLSSIVFAFIYNKMYVQHLISEGFKCSYSTHPSEYMANKLSLMLPILEND
tara:strand:- start:573 stop:890 length:318 start_codon:yes stop_codon:yes gene_type:complete